MLANALIIDSSPLQLYSSVLGFAPQRSIVQGKFEDTIPSWISLRPEPETNWSQCLQILEGHSSWVNSVAFSHDSAFVASGSYDNTVRLWRCDTGECVHVEYIGATVTHLSFKPDGSQLLTSHGAITIPKLPLVGQTEATQKLAATQTSAVLDVTESKGHRGGYGFSEDDSWITWHTALVGRLCRDARL